MSLDKTRIPKLSDSSRKFISSKQRKLMNNPFVERSERIRNKKGNKVSGRMVGARSQKASEEKSEMLEVEIHPNPVLDENHAGVGRSKMEIEG